MGRGPGRPKKQAEEEYYQTKLDYSEWVVQREDQKKMAEYEEKLSKAGLKFIEVLGIRTEVILGMRDILKHEKNFGKIMKALGISKDIIFDIYNRDYLYNLCDVEREDTFKITARLARKLRKNKEDFTAEEITRIILDPDELKSILAWRKRTDKQGTITERRAIEIQEIEEKIKAKTLEIEILREKLSLLKNPQEDKQAS